MIERVSDISLVEWAEMEVALHVECIGEDMPVDALMNPMQQAMVKAPKDDLPTFGGD